MSDVNKNNITNEIKVAFIADDIKNLNEFGILHNTTFSLMIAVQELGKKVFLIESKNLKIVNSTVYALCDEVLLKREVGNYLQVKSSEEIALKSFNVIFARKDPPINEAFVSYAQILSLIELNKFDKPFIINSPLSLISSNEKLFTLDFPNLIPETIVTSNKNEIISFLNVHKEIVVKPLFNKGGEGVFYLKLGDVNVNQIVELYTDGMKKIIVQKYLPEVLTGDKRIILLNGDPVGAIVRIPKEGEFRTHISRGASFKSHALSKRDLEICEAIKPFLIKQRLYFVAIDVIGDYLIEVNFTCPANLYETEQSVGKPLTKMVIEWAIRM